MKKSYDVNTQVATFTFDGLEPLTFTVGKCSAKVEAEFLGHGVLARLGDMAAVSRKQKDGSVITVTEAMRRAEIEAGIAHYESGTEQWELRATALPAPQNPTWLAIAMKKGMTYEAYVAERAAADLAELAAMGE